MILVEGRSHGVLRHVGFAVVELCADGTGDDDVDSGRHSDARDGCPLPVDRC